MVTVNDAPRRLFNGDIGVVVEQPETGARLRSSFPTGSRFGTFRGCISVGSRPSTRSPFTRAKIRVRSGCRRAPVSRFAARHEGTALHRDHSGSPSVTLIGSLDAVLAAVSRPTRRASGLRARLDARTSADRLDRHPRLGRTGITAIGSVEVDPPVPGARRVAPTRNRRPHHRRPGRRCSPRIRHRSFALRDIREGRERRGPSHRARGWTPHSHREDSHDSHP